MDQIKTIMAIGAHHYDNEGEINTTSPHDYELS